jgi:uncharacterized membrane protein YkvA (DUF1232 family)
MAKQNPQGDQIASSPLFKKFLGTAEEYLKRPTRVKQLLNDAYKKASEKKDIGSIAHEAWETMQTLFRLIRASIAGEYTGLPTTTVVAAVAVTIYFMSPIDLIPDFIPVLGLLDDVALVAWFGATIKEEMDRFTEWEKTRPAVMEVTGGAASSDSYTTATDVTPSTSRPPTSNTDSGLGSPESSRPASSQPISTGPATHDAAPHADIPANTTDSSRYGSDTGFSGGDPGGNVR